MQSVMGRREALRLLAVLSAMTLASGCGRGSRPERTVDVAVVGAGLSGLYAAMLLERAGLAVQVFEASDRIGGRLWTLDAIPGAPEGGGNVIGSTYARIVDTARELGVTMERVPPMLPEDAGTRLWVDNSLITPEQWSASPLNPFPPAVRSLLPARVLPALLPPVPLVDQSDWRLPGLAQHDIPITDALAAHRLDADGFGLLDVNFGYGNSLGQTSLLHYYHVMANLAAAIAAGGSLLRVVGGNQRLPEAMAAALRDPVLTGARVQRIARETDGFHRLEVAGGAAYRADRVVLALPTPAYAGIDFEPALPI
jgi:monoamine oxidase